jgi:peptidoglycan/xylan/chitin deacetylase (PgdA/CDA1 family)
LRQLSLGKKVLAVLGELAGLKNSDRVDLINSFHRWITGCGLHHLYTQYHKLLGYRVTPILMYHSVGESSACRYNLSVRAFEKQIQFFASNFRCIRLRDVLREFHAPCINSNAIPLAITFDDAYQNLLTNAHPIMERYGIAYTVFVPTGFIGSTASWRVDKHLPLLSAQELLELKGSGLADFGSHTVNHCSMVSLSEDEMAIEAGMSRKYLSGLLQVDSIDMFAYPYGGPSDYSKQTTRVLRRIGYNLAVTSRTGSMNSFRCRFMLRRIVLNEADDDQVIFAKLKGEYDWYFIKELFGYTVRRAVLG